MKERFISIKATALKALAGGFALLALTVFALPQSAHAILAANTQISNTASLSYNDGTGTQTAAATPVVVTVALVSAAPSITSGPDQITAYSGTATTTDTFTITAGSNGPDTYTITVPSPTVTNTSGATLTPSVTSVTLGATTVLSNSGATITVPSDGASDSSVNGIAVGDTVVVNGTAYTVSGISDNATGTSTITLSSDPGTLTAGTLIAERQSITVTVDPNNISTPGTSVTVENTITVTSGNGTGPALTCTDTVTNIFTNGAATLTKYVRNVTAAVTGTTPYTYGSNTYYATGVTGKSGDVLEYVLVANNSGTGSVSASVITDSLPTTYVTFSGTTVTYVNAGGSTSTPTIAAGDDIAVYSSPTLSVNVGTGATSSAGGTIGAGETVRVLYQVTINN